MTTISLIGSTIGYTVSETLYFNVMVWSKRFNLVFVSVSISFYTSKSQDMMQSKGKFIPRIKLPEALVRLSVDHLWMKYFEMPNFLTG